MQFIIANAIYFLLCISVFILQKEKNPILFMKLTFLYIITFVSFKTDSITIPIGIILGVIFLEREKNNASNSNFWDANEHRASFFYSPHSDRLYH